MLARFCEWFGSADCQHVWPIDEASVHTLRARLLAAQTSGTAGGAAGHLVRVRARLRCAGRPTLRAAGGEPHHADRRLQGALARALARGHARHVVEPLRRPRAADRGRVRHDRALLTAVRDHAARGGAGAAGHAAQAVGAGLAARRARCIRRRCGPLRRASRGSCASTTAPTSTACRAIQTADLGVLVTGGLCAAAGAHRERWRAAARSAPTSCSARGEVCEEQQLQRAAQLHGARGQGGRPAVARRCRAARSLAGAAPSPSWPTSRARCSQPPWSSCPTSTGLSREMVRWAVRSALDAAHQRGAARHRARGRCTERASAAQPSGPAVCRAAGRQRVHGGRARGGHAAAVRHAGAGQGRLARCCVRAPLARGAAGGRSRAGGGVSDRQLSVSRRRAAESAVRAGRHRQCLRQRQHPQHHSRATRRHRQLHRPRPRPGRRLRRRARAARRERCTSHGPGAGPRRGGLRSARLHVAAGGLGAQRTAGCAGTFRRAAARGAGAARPRATARRPAHRRGQRTAQLPGRGRHARSLCWRASVTP